MPKTDVTSRQPGVSTTDQALANLISDSSEKDNKMTHIEEIRLTPILSVARLDAITATPMPPSYRDCHGPPHLACGIS